MGRYLKHYDKDYMKMAIIKQDETFRQQVQELHRLYRVQKLLMNDMSAELEILRKSSKIQHPNWPSSRPYQTGKDFTAKDEVEDERDLELTLATGSCRQRKKESSLTSNSGTSVSSSSTENGNGWGEFHVAGMNLGSHRSKGKNKFDVEARMNEDRMKQPPWLFQCLSLNMT